MAPNSRLHPLKIFANPFSILPHTTTCNRYAFRIHKLPFNRGLPLQKQRQVFAKIIVIAATIFIDILPFSTLYHSAKGIEYTAYVRNRANVIREDNPRHKGPSVRNKGVMKHRKPAPAWHRLGLKISRSASPPRRPPSADWQSPAPQHRPAPIATATPTPLKTPRSNRRASITDWRSK